MAAALPEFANPPVIEVLCGVTFASLDRILVPHFGLLWDRFRDEYSRCEEHPPLNFPIEAGAEKLVMQIKLKNLPPLPRVWFVRPDGSSAIQVQRNAFLHNWRRVQDSDEYPHYDNIIPRFERHLALFKTFLDDNDLGEIKLRQCELKYVNQIVLREPFDEASRDVFRDFSWNSEKTFLPSSPAGFHLRFFYQLPDEAGRLFVSLRRATRLLDKKDVVIFDLTARGKPRDASDEAVRGWYDLSHEWIVRGFADLTSSKMQRTVWDRKDA